MKRTRLATWTSNRRHESTRH